MRSTRSAGRRHPCHPKATANPIRSCRQWGLPCRPCYQGRGELLPHRFTLTPPKASGFISVALSRGLPQPGVTWHRASVRPGRSSPQGHKAKGAVIRPSARIVYRRTWGGGKPYYSHGHRLVSLSLKISAPQANAHHAGKRLTLAQTTSIPHQPALQRWSCR